MYYFQENRRIPKSTKQIESFFRKIKGYQDIHLVKAKTRLKILFQRICNKKTRVSK